MFVSCTAYCLVWLWRFIASRPRCRYVAEGLLHTCEAQKGDQLFRCFTNRTRRLSLSLYLPGFFPHLAVHKSPSLPRQLLAATVLTAGASHKGNSREKKMTFRTVNSLRANESVSPLLSTENENTHTPPRFVCLWLVKRKILPCAASKQSFSQPLDSN